MSWDRRSAEAKEFPFAKGIYAYPTPITIHDPWGVMMDTDPWGSSPQERLERGASFERGRMIIFFRPGYVGSLLLNCGNLRTAFGKHVGDCGCFFFRFRTPNLFLSPVSGNGIAHVLQIHMRNSSQICSHKVILWIWQCPCLICCSDIEMVVRCYANLQIRHWILWNNYFTRPWAS